MVSRFCFFLYWREGRRVVVNVISDSKFVTKVLLFVATESETMDKKEYGIELTD